MRIGARRVELDGELVWLFLVVVGDHHDLCRRDDALHYFADPWAGGHVLDVVEQREGTPPW